MRRALLALGSGLAVASLGLTLDNLRRVRVPDLDAVPPAERVAVLVPMRDEADRAERCVEALLAAAEEMTGPAEVVVLDDGSRDGTGELLARMAAFEPRLRVLTGRPPPRGWLGKPWACRQLAEHAAAAGATVLVFVDADVVVERRGLRASVALLRDSGLDVVCPYPRQLASGVAERLVQPMLVWSWMSTLPLGAAERSPRPSLTAANGQLLVADLDAYERAGGHGGVRGAVLEDMELLRAVKRSGGRGVVADGSAVATCRMYDGWTDLRAGYTKSLWAAFGSPVGALAVQSLLVLVHVVPAAAAVRGSRVGLVGWAASVTARALVARRWGGRTTDALAHPVSVALLAGLTGDSLLARRRGRLRWKGRAVEAVEAR